MNNLSYRDVIENELTIVGKPTIIKVFKRIFISTGERCVFLYRIGQILKNKGYRIPSILIYNYLVKNFGIFLSYKAQIGIGLKLPHPNGIIIGNGSIIGENCTIFHQVTLGGKKLGDAKENNYPCVGNNVTIFSGAKLFGSIKIGDNCIIGANSVVNKSFSNDSTVIGSPGKKIVK